MQRLFTAKLPKCQTQRQFGPQKSTWNSGDKRKYLLLNKVLEVNAQFMQETVLWLRSAYMVFKDKTAYRKLTVVMS